MVICMMNTGCAIQDVTRMGSTARKTYKRLGARNYVGAMIVRPIGIKVIRDAEIVVMRLENIISLQAETTREAPRLPPSGL